MLPQPQATLWEKYRQAEHDCIKAVAKAALDDFLVSLSTLPMNVWKNWAYELCYRCFDKNDSFPIRMPLFEHVLFPALLAGIKEKRPGCARWMAAYSARLYHRPALRAELDQVAGSDSLLELALTHDPSDRIARRRLIELLVSWLKYTVHEVPSGVLGNGEENLADLSRLRELLRLEGGEEEHANLLEKCDLHFHRYPEYIRQQEEFESYSQYLEWWLRTRSGEDPGS